MFNSGKMFACLSCLGQLRYLFPKLRYLLESSTTEEKWFIYKFKRVLEKAPALSNTTDLKSISVVKRQYKAHPRSFCLALAYEEKMSPALLGQQQFMSDA